VPELTQHFIDWFHKTQGLPNRALSEEANTVLQTLPWPGNIRQLRNVIERILILGDGSGPIETSEIPGNEPKPETDTTLSLTGTIATLPLREARELFEREYLLTQINRFGGNISRTASFVGMERSALHRKLKSLGVVGSTRGGRGLGEFEE
jgi:two-component system nitrogen regulation response regulator NtrX